LRVTFLLIIGLLSTLALAEDGSVCVTDTENQAPLGRALNRVATPEDGATRPRRPIRDLRQRLGLAPTPRADVYVDGARYPHARQMINPRYANEDIRANETTGTTVEYRYHSSSQRDLQVQVREDDGLVRNIRGNLLDTSDGSLPSSEGVRQGGVRVYIYVMDVQGNIYVSDSAPGVFHHSSFLAGQPVAAAGEISVVNGRLMLINDYSGHYLPTDVNNQQVVTELRRRGVEVPQSAQQWRSGARF